MHPQLPLEIVHEILDRLAAKYLAKFRCVSKQCNEIINSYVAFKQLHRTLEDPKLLCIVYQQQREGNNGFADLFTSSISKETIEMVIPYHYSFQCCCNGLDCFISHRGPNAPAVLYNPLRQETVKLPLTTSYLSLGKTYGLGFDAKSYLFKVICFANMYHKDHPNKNFCRPELLILGQKSWKQIELPDHLQGLAFGNTVFLNGAIHCIIKRHPNVVSGKGNFDIIIVAFDIEKEEFRFIKPPSCIFSFQLFELGGLLALPQYSQSTKIWVLKDYMKGEWACPLKISTKPRLTVVGARENEVLLFGLPECYVSCDINTGRKTELIPFPRQISGSWIHCIYSHQLCLVPMI